MAKRTCLYEAHLALGARMIVFGGFDMPLRYGSLLDEHHACRRGAVCFDTSHMGEIRVHGRGAAATLEYMLSCRIAALRIGQCRYGLMCNESGGAVDDLLVYRMGADDFLLVVNAETRAGDVAWIQAHRVPCTEVQDLSDETGKVDLQGPGAPDIARGLLGAQIASLAYFRFFTTEFMGRPVLISRTGYTGEMGFEFYGAPDQTIAFWNACLEAGAQPAGLGARDTLRLEAGLPLHGHELCGERRVNESGLGRVLAMDKAFLGADALAEPPAERLAGVVLNGRRAARAGDGVRAVDGTPLGTVTSGSFAPSLGFAVAMAYLRVPLPPKGTPLRLGAAGLEGCLADLPFWKQGTARAKMGALLSPQNHEEVT